MSGKKISSVGEKIAIIGVMAGAISSIAFVVGNVNPENIDPYHKGVADTLSLLGGALALICLGAILSSFILPSLTKEEGS